MIDLIHSEGMTTGETLVVVSNFGLVAVSATLTVATWFAVEEHTRRMVAKAVTFRVRQARKIRREMQAEMAKRDQAILAEAERHSDEALAEHERAEHLDTVDTTFHGTHAVVLQVVRDDGTGR